MGLRTNNDDDDILDSVDDEIQATLIDDDCETNIFNSASFFDSINTDESIPELLLMMKRSYMLFILKLREEYLLPQGVTNIISTYIVTLIRHLEILLNKKAVLPSAYIYSSSTSSVPKQNQKIIEIYQLHETLNGLSNIIESISKSNYQFIKNCEKYLNYDSPEQVILSSPDEPIEHAYFIPIDRTISSMLNSQPLLSEILENIQQQRISVENDSDLMLSIRDGYYGNRFDEDSLLIQLYLDDIGLTNPLGAKRDKHKMTMIINDPDRIPLKGVVGPSPLRELIGFHATTSLPRDLMHDLIEGSSQYPVGMRKVRKNCFDIQMKDILLKHFNHIDFDTDLYQCNILIHNNIEYPRCGVYVIDLKPSHEQPIFAQVIMIIKKKEKWWLLVDILNTICYDEKLSAWQIQSTTRYSLIDSNDLTYYHKGLDIYIVNNLSFVSFISRLTLH
ncbi:unnamed protein product [Adineta steineri]|uniref:Uncharacterized protein n=1 Tax=Adineta steineri TaxID=433720 RepID=A0A816BLJ7_9BILA|nr:unnamed protein product [Adineta steineri]CAF1612328.1 unnamed protein product [Adineta steineri]